MEKFTVMRVSEGTGAPSLIMGLEVPLFDRFQCRGG